MDTNDNSKEYAEGILPGMEEYAIPPSPPQNSKEKRKHRDVHNLRLLASLYAADPLIGIPTLKAYCPHAISIPIAFHEARAFYRKHGHLKGFFVHFFIDDDLFECIRKSPERYVKMLKSADFIVAPDFSTYRNFPFPVLLKNAFDNMLLAAYYQREGVRVVANIIWSRPIFYDYTFSGQPAESVICVSSKSVDIRDRKGVQHWLHGYKEAIKRLKPKMVIRMGKIIPGEESIEINHIRVDIDNPYISRIRHGR